MKLLLLIATACLLTSVCSAQKKSYIKPQAGLLILGNSGDAAAQFDLEVGLKLKPQFTGGILAGALCFGPFSKPVFPVGLSFSFLKSESTKLSPYFNLAAGYPIYNATGTYIVSDGVNYHSGESSVKGRFFGKGGAGIAIPLKQQQKLLLSANYNHLILSGKVKDAPANLPVPARINMPMDIFSFNVGFVF